MSFNLKVTINRRGDQPQAIRALAGGLERGDERQTLLGVTGSGKTFTMANIIAQTQRPALVVVHNKNTGRATVQGVSPIFSRKRR